ncbi:hypothetical protein DPMN_154518 [Dreissena polymorpha]|uniref:Uncharacterized protein n=1 Tax=Dreissena polymorpha TaxID=45954 RepID=A0A9D4FL89_DREPO|nr:hypothetical protein DPMN_154516 [Dreissena polymorpha]KAH3800875.1 hypothetical protein DPMN_154518 [Dreissena polymorpha]
MLYVLILAFVLTCVSCGERNALGLSAKTNEDSVPLDPSRRIFSLIFGAYLGGSALLVGGKAAGWWKRRSTDVNLN